MSAETDSASFTDGVLDELLPDEFDWRAQVRSYPLPALLLAAVGGFLVGRAHGSELARSLADLATDRVVDKVSSLISPSSSDQG